MTGKENHNDRFEELCAGYVLKALDAEEREEFERMLQQADEEQIELYRQLHSAAQNLAFGAERKKPADTVKEHLMQAVREDAGEPDAHRSSGSVDKKTMAIAASFALLVVSLTLIFYSLNLRSQLHAKENRIETQQERITRLEEEIDRKNELLDILESREVDIVFMNGMEASPNGYGKIIWNAESQQALLQVSNLPAVPGDKQYQLWILKGNQPVSAGLFSVTDPNRDAFFKIEQMEAAMEPSTRAFVVTLEPRGGMPQPTGDTYLMGNMER